MTSFIAAFGVWDWLRAGVLGHVSGKLFIRLMLDVKSRLSVRNKASYFQAPPNAGSWFITRTDCD
jgi:hypothetical protein